MALKHRLFAEPYSVKQKTWNVYVVNEGVSVQRVRAIDAEVAIRKAKDRINKLSKDFLAEEEQ